LTPALTESLRSNTCITSAFCSVISPLAASLPFTAMVNVAAPFCCVPPAALMSALSDSTVADALPHAPPGPFDLTR
jgi:hypothetical protein